MAKASNQKSNAQRKPNVQQKANAQPQGKKEQSDREKDFAVPKENYKLLLIGFAIIVLGFILMAGGGSDDPNVFEGDKLFSFRRITLSTILVLFGFAFEIYAIMKKPKNKTKDESKENNS
ncbi:MAG: DUF3098 domain-containing protein [Prevotellaceae bacterium]|jgi:uncharacterized membrane protein|nr:DUF3098 domain-containing protein [Prevotellaceae bacterium]